MASKQRVVFIFLFIMSAGMLLFIGFQIIDYYKTGRAYTEENMRPSITCTGYIYSIKDITYANNELRFKVSNQEYSDYEVAHVTVKTNNRTYEINTRIPQGVEREVRATISNIPPNFTVYPENCFTHAKTCNIRTKTCS